MTRAAPLTLLASMLAGPTSTWALGIGDIQLESYLGQPLKASVELLAGPGEALEESCFQVKSGNDAGLPGVSGVDVSLQQKNGGTRLLLNSRRPVNEPAVALTVISDCPQRLSRQFMVLLDPPVIADAPVVQDAGAQPATVAATQSAMQSATPPAASQAASPRTTRSAKAAGKTAAAIRTHRATRPRASAPMPRLVLSGHNPAVADSPAFGMKLDRSLPEPGKYADSVPDARDLSDENASLNHKLAYLEAQLASLQRRNAELEQAERAAQASRPKPQPAANSWYSWLLLPALLAAGALLAWRWRSRRQALQQLAEGELGSPETRAASGWQMDPLPASLDKPVVARPRAGETPAAESHPAEMPPRTLKWAEDDGVEVDDSVVDEAEVFMAHGHADLAINLLEEHVRAAPDESPIPWMLLLDLLRRNKMAREYEETGKACKQHFNLRVPDWSEDEPGPEAAGLEAYPHILAELTRLWKSAECQAYLNDLIFDRRGGTRMGFDPPTFREIMLLRAIQFGEPASLPDRISRPPEKRVAGLP